MRQIQSDVRINTLLLSSSPAEERAASSSSSSASASASSSSHVSVVEMPPLPAARPGELRECYYNLAERGACSLLATNTSQQECCCTVGEGWGLGCQYHTCPPTGSGEATATQPPLSLQRSQRCHDCTFDNVQI